MTDWTRGDAASPTLMERATERRRELLTLSQMSGQRG
jgi:hypothetical protein